MTLWKHQLEAVEKAKNKRYYALFFDVGTGKTATAIHILRGIYNGNKCILNTLILCPLAICEQWKQEILKFSRIPADKIHVLLQAGRVRGEILRKTNGPIVITNYNALGMNKDFYPALLEWKPEVIICDESHLLKDPTSRRTTALVPLADKAKHVFCLTGTPILNTPMDIYAQYRVMDRGENFGKSYFAFKKQYCFDKNAYMPRHCYFPKWEIRQDKLPVITKIMGETSSQAKKSECLELPDLVSIPIGVEMSAKQAKVYAQMEKEFVAEVGDSVITAEFALTKTLRLQQILCGFVQKGDEELHLIDEDLPRIKALEEILEPLHSKKVIIWCTFKASYKMLGEVCDKLKMSYTYLTGEQTSVEKQESIKKFTKGDTSVLISNPAAGGTGINLIESGYAIYFSRSYSLAHHLQSEARNYRAGSEMHDKVTHYHIYCKNTLDETILDALRNKQSTGEALLHWARNMKHGEIK